MVGTAPAQTGFAQGLLGSIAPWMTGANPSSLDSSFSQYGGFQGLLDAMLQGGGPDTSAARMGAAMERSRALALEEAQQRQALAQGNIATAKSAMSLPLLQAYYSAAIGGSPGSGTSPNAPGAASGIQAGGYGGGPSNAPAPQDAPPLIRATAPQLAARGQSQTFPPSSQAPTGLPYSAPTLAQLSGMPVGGISPQMLRLGGLISGQSPLTTAQQLRAQQLAQAQQQYGPAIATLDTAMKAQSPAQYVSADPRLMATWQKMAPQLGFDPAKDFTDANVRTALAFARNGIAGAIGQPTIAPPVQVGTVKGPLGSLFSRNPITNALSQVKPEEALKPVVRPDGTVAYAPASQAAGQTPFNSETFINPSTTAGVARMIANYEMAPLNGYALRTPQGQAVMAAVKQLNPSYDATQYDTKRDARIKFAIGPQGNTVRSLSVANSHLDMLSDAAHALSQSDLPAFNKLVNSFGVHITGANAQTNFDAMRAIVGDEVVKAIIGTGGAEGDREEIKSAFQAARSPNQIEGVISKYEGLLGGQLRGMRRQYEKATGLHDFNSFVDTLAQRQLNSAANQALGGKPQPLNVGQTTSVGGFTVTRVK